MDGWDMDWLDQDQDGAFVNVEINLRIT